MLKQIPMKFIKKVDKILEAYDLTKLNPEA
jgi:hypothetical protein